MNCKASKAKRLSHTLMTRWKQEAQLLLGDRATRNDNLGWNDLQLYFKVIKSGTNRKLVYDFLLVVYSNFCRITHRFWEIRCEIVQWPWNMPKVIDSRVTWKLWRGHVCKMFRRKWTNKAKIAIFNYPCEYLHKPYTARNYVPWATLLSLTVYG